MKRDCCVHALLLFTFLASERDQVEHSWCKDLLVQLCVEQWQL